MQPGAPPPPPGYGYPPGYAPGPAPGGYGYPPGYGYPQAPIKSSTPRTLGTLSMVFGGIVVALSLFGLLAGNSFSGMIDHSHISKDAWNRYMSDVKGASMAMSGLMLAMSAALFYIGTGQRSYQRWAVRASVWWGIAAIAYLVLQLIVNLTVVLPAMDRLLEAVSSSRMRGTMSATMKIGVFSGLAFYLPYPIVMIVAFRKQANVDAMDQPPLPTATATTL